MAHRVELFNKLAFVLVVLFANYGLGFCFSLDEKPFHLSWTREKTRIDFVFSLEKPLKDKIELSNVNTDYFNNSLRSCSGHSACLLENGTLVNLYEITANQDHKTVFESSKSKSPERNSVYLNHYCNSHWNPPVHLSSRPLNHIIEWHSPYACENKTVGYEHPCYYYTDAGELIDLTPLVWCHSTGKFQPNCAHKVNVSDFPEIDMMDIGVCNDVQSKCGPNVSACYHKKEGIVESGHLNSTSLKMSDKSLNLTYFGQYNQNCTNSRTKTTIKFVCKKMTSLKNDHFTEPKLISHDECESIIEWPTVQACLMSEIQVPATECSINHEPTGIYINLSNIDDHLETDSFPLGNGRSAKIAFGICHGIDRQKLRCEGKNSSATSACLITEPETPSDKPKTVILGSIFKTFLRFADDGLYLEYSNFNKTCNFTIGSNLTATRQLGARIEFSCGDTLKKPSFIGYDQCTYIFSWPVQWMCFDDMIRGAHQETSSTTLEKHPSIAPSSVANISSTVSTVTSTVRPRYETSSEGSKIEKIAKPKSSDNPHDATIDREHKAAGSEKATGDLSGNSQAKSSTVAAREPTRAVTKPSDIQSFNSDEVKVVNSRMSGLHKAVMIFLILGSLIGFVVVIFVLDSKTRLGLTIGRMRRNARRAFQPGPVPYSRVDEFNDHLDL